MANSYTPYNLHLVRPCRGLNSKAVGYRVALAVRRSSLLLVFQELALWDRSFAKIRPYSVAEASQKLRTWARSNKRSVRGTCRAHRKTVPATNLERQQPWDQEAVNSPMAQTRGCVTLCMETAETPCLWHQWTLAAQASTPHLTISYTTRTTGATLRQPPTKTD